MACKVVLRPAAIRDLDRLYAFIRQQSGPATALGYVNRIRAHCEGLADFPERGVRRDDLRPGLRITGYERRVAIAFTSNGERVTIGRIFYAGRDVEALLRDAGKPRA